MKKLYLGLVAAAAVATTVAVPGAFARTDVAASPQAAPGVTSRTILVGTTLPLSGPASLYARIGTGMRAYFSYINARRARAGHRGVYGRQLQLRIYDDQYSEALTVQQTRRLVEQDRVFALLGGLGTENQQAVRLYLNQRKVPQLYVSTGLSEFGRLHRQYPWTLGWQPDYTQEGRLHGRYLRQNRPNARVAVLHQNDDYGREYLAGFRAVVGASRIVAVETYPRNAGAAVAAPVARLRASDADTFLVIATPTESITALTVAFRLGWRPLKLVNSVGATKSFLGAVQAATGSAESVNGVITTTYLKDPASPRYRNDPQVRLYKRLMAKYAPGFPEPRDDNLFFYGMAKADTFVQALYRAGRNPTRASLMRAARNLNANSPWLLRQSTRKPGRIVTSARSAFPIRYQRLARFNNGSYTEFGSLVKTR